MQKALYPNQLRAVVKDAGLTMREVHRQTGIPESTLRWWASGHGVIPKEERATLARLIGCESHDLAPLHGQAGTAVAGTPCNSLPEQRHNLAVVPVLSALLEHPEFQAGLALAQEMFLECHEEASLMEDEMIEEVERSLRRRITERDKKIARVMGWEVLSYLHALGFVFGTINHGLTYAR
jgi:transcriptional regulator with XRE-family HTH domain